MDSYDRLLMLAHELGADSAKVIDPATVVTAPWPAIKCQFGCQKYGTCAICPPRTPKYTETREILNCYHKAILFRCHHEEEPSPIAAELERQAFLSGFYKALGFGGGPCHVCKKCNPDKCNFPAKSAPSMESCGVDVFATVRANGYEINTIREKDEPQNYFGLLLLE